MPSSASPREMFNTAFQEAVTSFARDMPQLMHGAGDVDPSHVQPETAQLVAALTAQYLQKLTQAALESHEMLHDGDGKSSTSYPLPPPPFPHSRQPQRPRSPTGAELVAAPTSTTKKDSKKNDKTSHLSPAPFPEKKKKRKERGWDEPLPEPKIRNAAGATATATNTTNKLPALPPPDEKVHVDEWVGAAGVDLLEHRARSVYVQGVLNTSSFIFPLCHDVYTYNRITEAQSFKRSLKPLLIDPVVTELVRVETKKKKDRTSDPEEEDEASEEEDQGEVPMWPGLEDLLPIYRDMS